MLRSIAAQRASLMNDYGATHGPNAPEEFEVVLMMAATSDEVDEDFGAEDAPDVDQLVEVMATTMVDTDEDDGTDPVETANGYARVTVPNDATVFPEPDETGVLTTAVITFPAATAEYPDTVVAVRLVNAATGDVWDEVDLPEDDRIDVTTAGTVPAVRLALFYSEQAADDVEDF